MACVGTGGWAAVEWGPGACPGESLDPFHRTRTGTKPPLPVPQTGCCPYARTSGLHLSLKSLPVHGLIRWGHVVVLTSVVCSFCIVGCMT